MNRLSVITTVRMVSRYDAFYCKFTSLQRKVVECGGYHPSYLKDLSCLVQLYEEKQESSPKKHHSYSMCIPLLFYCQFYKNDSEGFLQ